MDFRIAPLLLIVINLLLCINFYVQPHKISMGSIAAILIVAALAFGAHLSHNYYSKQFKAALYIGIVICLVADAYFLKYYLTP